MPPAPPKTYPCARCPSGVCAAAKVEIRAKEMIVSIILNISSSLMMYLIFAIVSFICLITQLRLIDLEPHPNLQGNRYSTSGNDVNIEYIEVQSFFLHLWQCH